MFQKTFCKQLFSIHKCNIAIDFPLQIYYVGCTSLNQKLAVILFCILKRVMFYICYTEKRQFYLCLWIMNMFWNNTISPLYFGKDLGSHKNVLLWLSKDVLSHFLIFGGMYEHRCVGNERINILFEVELWRFPFIRIYCIGVSGVSRLEI